MAFILSPELEEYIEQHTTPHDTVLAELERTTYLDFLMPRMLSGKVQGQFLSMISGMIQPKRILEIGTYTGYSAICFAKGLATDGKLITLDINEELSDTVKLFIDKSGLTDKIELRIGNAMEIIPTLNETFDLVFIDADKENYSNYFDLVFPKIRIGGYILADNVLWSGKVIENKIDRDTKALKDFSDKVQQDNRVENVMLSIRDGILMIKKIKN
jgi:predicted O-methyltransferase YrrM